MSKLIRGLYNLQSHQQSGVATIGNFDGLHLGHQAVLRQLAAKAAELQRPSLLITFEPPPSEFLAPAKAPARLTQFREKFEILRAQPVDWMLCLRFNSFLARMEAADFIRMVLVERLRLRYLVAGKDFCFGRDRRGNLTLLQRAGKYYGFEVAPMPALCVEGARVSSTRIRQALAQGNLSRAEQLLGRPYRMSGRVIQGDKRGRTLGFPTANIALRRHRMPLTGVFAVEVYGLDNEPLPGVANVGVRPTIGGRRALLEVHLLDFERDIYGRYLQVDFLRQLRPEKCFESLAALGQQIERDCGVARDFFTSR
ncbi:bifunctional riboflavin kinase/FAD synthetase [Nitrosococcus oceani]|uniref:Riboflavin biosynthesis protein n=2 Tax=Nitrosococcus oceani TaxID=1229 RepID=Q3J9K1_NITOC|nr:bifunctional riboflavin kinase/FAD synthetase [Nitrosococcus oceani]ABA58495.1 FMN adenylyltransferase [Nitrosococcus oceani ATCC 19707]KFI19099.1 FMN adenylyltransferase [Nitrosococcus oceani C-27]KFI22316.1 FMN adenylyltransferase [Nitrosococcus oceani]